MYTPCMYQLELPTLICFPLLSESVCVGGGGGGGGGDVCLHVFMYSVKQLGFSKAMVLPTY